MAVKPSNAALTALRNTRRAKQEELGRAYEAMGGSNTALVSNSQFAPNTIPSLKRAIENRYAEAQNGGRDTYGDLQAMSSAYNDYANANTNDKLKHVKSESYAQLVSQPTIMGMANPMYGNLSDDMKSAGLTLEELERFNKAKSRQTYEDVASQIGAEHPVIATGLAAVEQPLMSLGNVAKNVRNYALGNPIENNFNPAAALRQSVAENNIDTKVGNFAYGVGNSMADMLIASLAGANAGPGIMGLEKADQVMNSAVDRGLTPNQIMAEGIGSAITTALTERIPFKEFKAGNNISRAMISEGLQEGSEDIADTILDEIITRIGGNNEKSEYNLMIQAYRDAGYSEEEAKNAALIDYLKQLGLDSLAGAISGGGMGAVGNISQGYNAFTGRPRTNAETESNVTADAEPETIPTLRDSRAEEQAIQDQRNAELAQLTEAVSQMREQQNTQTVPQVQNYDPEEMEYLRNTLLDANSININPIQQNEAQEQHTPEQNKVIQEYNNSRDERLANWIAARRNGETRDWPIPVAKVSNEVADYIKNELGISTYGNDVVMNNSSLRHIDKHIDNPNKSPITDEDISRIGYVLENPDEIVKTGRVSTTTRLSNNDPAPTFMLRKRIDGHYYVVEAATDAKAKTNYVVTAFIEQAGKEAGNIKELFKESYHVPNALAEASPLADVQNVHDLDSSAESVTQTEDNVNYDTIQTVEEATAVLNDEISALKKEVGNHPLNIEYFSRNERGEVESEDSDRVQTGRYKTSKAYTNTAEKSGNLTDEQRSAVEADGRMQYQENSEKESVAEAEKRIIEGGWKGEFDKLTQKDAKDFNNVDVDELFILWRHYKEEAMALDAKGLDSTSAWQKTIDCLTQVKAVGSSAGSELQAFAKWSRNNTPEGLLSEAETIIEEVTRGAKKNPWFAQIAKETKGKTRQMDVAFIKEFLTEAEKLDGLDIDSREAKHIMANLGKMVNSRIPVTLREKIVTILMDNMLGNFRTLIARNAGGNVGFNLIEQKVTKNLAAKIDKALSAKLGTTRNISENTSEGRSAYREGFKEAVKQEIYDFQNNIQSARSGENTLRTAVANNRQIFSQKNVFGKIGNLYNKLVKTGLSSGDRPFYEGVYNQYMTEFRKMREDGLLKEMSDAEFEEIAKANAQIKALEAVYQDDSSMAQAFMGMKNAVNELSKGIVGADVLSQFTMPFVKTPANIIQRAIEYSPIGIVKNAIQTVREVRHAMTENEIMDFDQQRFATETARNIIGSVMFMMAIMAAKSGALTGGYSEDKDMAQAQREAGMQEYALHNPLGFNGDVDVSWLPVVGNNLVAAAAAYDAASKPELTMGQRIGQGLTAGLRTQFESSALQGLQRLVGGSNYSSSNGGDLLTNAVDTLKSGATQFIPSLARQAASTADPYRRQLTGANPDDYYVNSVLNSIPGLRQSLQPRITRTGEYMEQNVGRSGLWKAFDNFINPATITRGTEDAVRDEAMRLFEATGNNIAFQPGVSINELKTEDHVPTAEEFTQYQQAAYGNMNQIATQVINSSYYQNLTDGEKETLLDSIYKAVKSVEKANILGTDKSNLSGAAKAYNEGGAEGLIDYATAKSVLAEMGMDNTVKNREYILETLNEGGTEAVNQILELSDELVQAGLTGSLTEQYAYNHAAQYIPSLTPAQFATEYTNLNYDGQSGITQKDILAYVNQNPTAYTDEDMYRLWNAYGQSSWSKQPYWNGEKWTSK